MTFDRDYYRKNKQKNREIEKMIGIRYRSDEANPKETFTEFKTRIKKTKAVGIFSLLMVFVFQLTNIVF